MRRMEIMGQEPTEEEQGQIKNYHNKILSTPVIDYLRVNLPPAGIVNRRQKEYEEQSVPVKSVSFNDKNFFVTHVDDAAAKEVGVVLEVAQKTIDAVYEEILLELKKAGLPIDELELKKHFILKNDMLDRVVFNFNPAGGALDGIYDVGKHRYILNCNNFFDRDGNFLINDFVGTLTHELLHFVSFSKVNFDKSAADDDKPAELTPTGSDTSGFSRYEGLGEERHSAFHDFNEAVTALYTEEVVGRIRKLIDVDENNPSYNYRKTDLSETSAKIETFKDVLDYLAKYSGVDYNTLWSSIKRAYLEGQSIDDKEVVSVLEECFGSGFVDNFLKYFQETDRGYQPSNREVDQIDREVVYYEKFDLASIKKRWEENGAIRLQKWGKIKHPIHAFGRFFPRLMRKTDED